MRQGLPGQADTAARVTVHDSAEALIRSSDLVVFATIAATPHVTEPAWFDHHPLVLHVSLRDLAPEVLLVSASDVDDVEHCLKAETSPHLVERLTGNRDYLEGTLDDVMAGRVTRAADTARPSGGGVGGARSGYRRRCRDLFAREQPRSVDLDSRSARGAHRPEDRRPDMTSAPATSEPATDEPTPGRICEKCPHPWAEHDAIGRRYCSASIASARTDRGCVCRTR